MNVKLLISPSAAELEKKTNEWLKHYSGMVKRIHDIRVKCLAEDKWLGVVLYYADTPIESEQLGGNPYLDPSYNPNAGL